MAHQKYPYTLVVTPYLHKDMQRATGCADYTSEFSSNPAQEFKDPITLEQLYGRE
jgi:hypothetical protein